MFYDGICFSHITGPDGKKLEDVFPAFSTPLCEFLPIYGKIPTSILELPLTLHFTISGNNVSLSRPIHRHQVTSKGVISRLWAQNKADFLGDSHEVIELGRKFGYQEFFFKG